MLTGAGRLGLIPRCDVVVRAAERLDARFWWTGGKVGRAATRTVVVSIIGIIVIDAIFALCTNALGV